MFFHKLIFLFFLELVASVTILAQEKTLYISEIMSSNGNATSDEYNENDDWIELYNYGSVPINLSGLYISDELENATKMRIEGDLVINADSYLILWADGSPDQGNNHLDFKLSENETIIISDDKGVIDFIKIENQKIDISFGKLSADGEYCYFENPTPGQDNLLECFKFLFPVEVSHSSGNYTNTIFVQLSHNEGANVFFTVDGSIPTSQSQQYNGSAIEISNNTVLRTIAYKQDHLVSDISTNTYTFNEEYSIPILYVTSNGNKINGDDNSQVHVELLSINNEQIFSEVVSSRLHGGDDQLSFKCFFGAKHGGRKVKISLFEDKPDVTEFESLIFRQAGNDGLNTSTARRSHMRDGFLSTIINRGDFNFKASGFRQVSVYLDGQYHGLFNMRERIDNSFIENNYKVKDSDPKCFIEYKFGEPSNINEIEGTWSYYENKLWSKCFDADLSNDEVFIEATQSLNIEDFTDYWMHEIFIGNFDWLTNNVYFWSPISESGKFRWILWDTDVSIGLNGKPDWNSLEWATSTEPGRPLDGKRTAIIRGLLTNKNYEEFFITRYCDLLNSEFSSTSTIGILDELAGNIIAEIPRHTAKWGRGSLETWNKELNAIKEYIDARPEHVRGHIKNKFPSIGDIYNLDLETSIPGAGYFDINTISVSEEFVPWKGKYFNNLPLALTVHANEGYRFVGWQHNTDLSNRISLNPDSDTTLIALFEVINDSEFDVVINEISYKQTDGFKSGDWVELYNNSDEHIDLSNWSFEDSSLSNEVFIFSDNSKIEAGQYIVLTKDKDVFRTIYPNVESIFGNLDFGLSKYGESLKLYDNSSNLVDCVTYIAEHPWPVVNNTNSIKLIDVELDNNVGESWKLSYQEKGSPGFKNDGLATNTFTEYLESDMLQVYPNPSNNLINIVTTSEGVINIFNLNGSLILKFPIDNKPYTLDLSNYSIGSYIIYFEGVYGEKASRKFRKE